MEPDRHVGPQPPDQAHRKARLDLGRRRAARGGEVAPRAREVPVQVDAARVRPPLRGVPVRVEVGDDPERPVRRRARVEQPGRDHAARALVAVDAADDEHARVPSPDPEGPDRPAERARAELRRGDAVPGKPDVEVVVVVLRQHLDDRRRAGETRARADEDLDGARGDEPVDELLREPAGDLPGPVGRALAAVAPRVVDVRVEPVLVRRVARRAEAFAELAALRAREVADPDPCRLGVRRPVRGRHVEEGRDEAPGAGAPPVAVGGDPADRVPREERVALGGEGDARDEAAVPRQADRARLGRGRRGGRGARGGQEGSGEQGEPRWVARCEL